MTLDEICQHLTAETLARMYADMARGMYPIRLFSQRMIVYKALRNLIGQEEADNLIDYHMSA